MTPDGPPPPHERLPAGEARVGPSPPAVVPQEGDPGDASGVPRPPIDGVRVVPLRRFEDERGWFVEARRESWFEPLGGRPSRQTNVVWSRAGVIRGLHFHEAGQDDLFFAPVGEVRVVLFDRREDSPTYGTAWSHDIGESNLEAVYIPGRVAHGYEALTDCVFLYHVTHEYDAAAPDEHGFPWNDERVRHLWRTREPILSARDRT